MFQLSSDILRDILFWVQQKRWLIIIFFISLLMLSLPNPNNLSIIGYRTLIIVFIVIALIITEPIPLPAIALLIAVLEVLFQIATPSEVAKTYMNDSVFFIMGSLMMAVAIIHQGLDKKLALAIIKITGNKVKNIILGFTSIAAILSSFIGEHTVVALMLPVGLSLVKKSSYNTLSPNLTILILFSIAYGSTIGSIGTPTGGARNAIMLEYLRNIPESTISINYIQWIIMAYPMVIIGIISIVYLLQKTFKSETKQLDTSIRRLKIQVAHQGALTGREFLTLLIFTFIFFCWVFFHELYGLGIIAIGGAFIFLAIGLIDWKEISQHTNWGVILLFASIISLGVQMKNTGAAIWIGNSIISYCATYIIQFETMPYIINIIITTFFSNIMSSSGTVAVLGPITLNMGGNTLLMGLTTAISSAFGFFSAVAAPACMIIYSSGLVSIYDFIKAGWKIACVLVFSLIVISKYYWPLVIKWIL